VPEANRSKKVREARARHHDSVAVTEESAEQTMHAAASALGDAASVHKEADRISDQARSHRRKADAIRSDSERRR
jgi:hypothetical protein